MNGEKRSYVKNREFVLYGIANGGQCISYNTLTGYLTYFFVNIFNVDARIVSSMLFLEGIWDAINDPIMGTLVDKTRTRWGKLRPYLLAVPVPLALTTVLLFSGPLLVGDYASTDYRKVIYMIITYFAWEFMYTIGDVPFWGMSTAISPNPADRTKAISSARFISNIVGGIPGILIPIMIDLVSGGVIGSGLRTVFCIYSIITGCLGMGLFSLAGLFIKERVVQSDEQPSVLESLKSMFANKPLRILILKDLLSSLGGIAGVFSTYYFVDVLGSASISLVTGIPGTIVNFVSYLFIPFFKRFFDNKQLIIVSKLVPTAGVVLKFLVGIGSKRYAKMGVMVPMLMLEGVINSVFSGVNNVVPMEMIGETVDYAEWTTGQRTEGISFSAITFLGKFSGAMSRALGTFLIPLIGYKTSNTTSFVAQTEATKRNIFLMNSIVPALLGLIGLIPMLKYDLVGEKRERMLSELAERRAAKVKAMNEE